MILHVDVLLRLNELGMWAWRDRVSAVSGGSITAGVLATTWNKLTWKDNITTNFDELMDKPVRRMSKTGVDVKAVLLGSLPFGPSVSDRVAAAYRKHLFGDAMLQHLPHKPRFIFNSTNLESGVLLRFSKPYLGDDRAGRVMNPDLRLAVDTVRPNDLDRADPCNGWTLAAPLSHRTVQHREFAAAARGQGSDLANWQVESVHDAVRADPAGAYSQAVSDVLEAFWADGKDDAPLVLSEFGGNAVFPGSIGMGFHFVDYVVHRWDVDASRGVDYELPADVLAAALPLVLAVPDRDARNLDSVLFDRNRIDRRCK